MIKPIIILKMNSTQLAKMSVNSVSIIIRWTMTTGISVVTAQNMLYSLAQRSSDT